MRTDSQFWYVWASRLSSVSRIEADELYNGVITETLGSCTWLIKTLTHGPIVPGATSSSINRAAQSRITYEATSTDTTAERALKRILRPVVLVRIKTSIG